MSRQMTRRQVEIAELVIQGWENNEIGRLLNISVDGVKYHCYHIYKHNKVRTRHEFIAKYYRNMLADYPYTPVRLNPEEMRKAK